MINDYGDRLDQPIDNDVPLSLQTDRPQPLHSLLSMDAIADNEIEAEQDYNPYETQDKHAE